MKADPVLALLHRVAPSTEIEKFLSSPGHPEKFDGELLAAFPIAALLGLIELRRRRLPAEKVRPLQRFRPTLLASLRPWSSGEDPKIVLGRLNDRLASAAQLLSADQNLYCILADWNRDLSLNEMLTILLSLSETFHRKFPQGELIGPSLKECLELAERFSLSPQSFLTRLLNHGITGCAGGPRTGQEKIALELGLSLSLLADLSFLADDFHVAEGPGEHDEDPVDSILLARHAAELTELKEEFEGQAWRWIYEPCWSETTFRHVLSSPFAVPVTKALLIARLILPEAVTVDARYPLVGRHLAQLLADYGVTSIGPAAVDPDSAASLGVPLLSEVATIELAFPSEELP